MKELWYVSCSPRNPAKIKGELTLLKKLEGEEWNKKDKDGNHITQLMFAKMLKDLSEFEGEASGRESDFSARDRVAPMKTYGFVHLDSEGCLKITKAGNALINGENEEHIFLMQLLKWQYPSFQHRGPIYLDQPKSLFQGKKLGFSIFPFVFTLYVANELNGVTKREIAIFLLPHRRMSRIAKVISDILVYRQEREAKQGRRKKLEYDDKIHERLYKKIYSEELSKCKSRRNRKELLKKKISNSRDVADACIRLFRHTGLFTATRNRLTLNAIRKNETEVILNKQWKPVSFFKDVERFYIYFGDHEKPELPFLVPQFLVDKVLTLQAEIMKLVDPKDKMPMALRIRKGALLKESQTSLLGLLSQLKKLYRKAKRNSITKFLRTPKGQKDVFELYEAIIAKDVTDPSTFFEWNSWRAMIALDDCKDIVSYMKMDDQLQPVDCARGNVPDILIDFDSYIVAMEVTLTHGRRQYFTETEPVTFHVGKCQHDEKSRGTNRKVYGLFVAPQINKHTANYLWQYISRMTVPDYGYVTVVPFNLDVWTDILRFANSFGYLRKHALGRLLGSIESLGKDAGDVEEWLNSFTSAIEAWKSYITKN